MPFLGKSPPPAALTASDITDGIVSNAKLAQDIISADTALGATPADTDEFLVSDAGTLKRMDYSYIKASNTPAFKAISATFQAIDSATHTQVVFGTELIDTDSAFASNTFTVPTGEGGKYFLFAQVGQQGWATNRLLPIIRTGGDTDISCGESTTSGAYYHITSTSTIAELSAADTVDVTVYQDSGSSQNLSQGFRVMFLGYKLIE